MLKESSTLMKIFNLIYDKYAKNPGNMLIHTGVIGWALSATAQICGIVFNDKLTVKQKMYLIPQESADAFFNVVSFYAVTRVFNSLAKNLVKTGKWLPKDVAQHLKTKGIKGVGTEHFDMTKLDLPTDISKSYYKHYQGLDVGSTLAGSIESCNILTPIFRNHVAAKKQKENMMKYDSKKQIIKVEPKKLQYNKPSFTDFSSGSLKI